MIGRHPLNRALGGRCGEDTGVGWRRDAANRLWWEFQRSRWRRRVGATGAASESHGGRIGHTRSEAKWDRERGRHWRRNGARGLRSGGDTRCSGRERRAAGRGEGDPTGDLLHGGRFLPAIGGDVAEGGMPSREKEGGTVVVAGLGLQEDGRSWPDDGTRSEVRVMKDPVDEV